MVNGHGNEMRRRKVPLTKRRPFHNVTSITGASHRHDLRCDNKRRSKLLTSSFVQRTRAKYSRDGTSTRGHMPLHPAPEIEQSANISCGPWLPLARRRICRDRGGTCSSWILRLGPGSPPKTKGHQLGKRDRCHKPRSSNSPQTALSRVQSLEG
jgi:hypothetical protein